MSRNRDVSDLQRSAPAGVPGAVQLATAPSDRRLRVLQVHNYYQQAGGEDVVVANERALLASNGHHVDLYAADNDAINSIADKARVFLEVAHSERARLAFAAHLQSHRPDVVHVHNFFPLLTTSIYDACRSAGVPVVQTLHNFRIACANAILQRRGQLCDKCVEGSAYWAVVHRCYRNSALASFAVAHMIEHNRRRQTWTQGVDCFVALSQTARSIYIRAGVPADRIVLKPNFAPDPGAPDGRTRRGALYVGRLSPEKGVEELIEAWRGISYPLRIAGDGPLMEMLRSNTPPGVTLLGRLENENVRRELADAAFLLMPSRSPESFPVVLAEAFAAGLPAIVSNLGAPGEIVTDGVTGLLIPPGNPRAIAETSQRLIADPNLRGRLGDAARRTYLAKYTPNVNYSQLLAIYERVLGRVSQRAE